MNAKQVDLFKVWYDGINKDVKDNEFLMESIAEGDVCKLFNKTGARCGSVGCAAGYLPVFLSEHFVYYEDTAGDMWILDKNYFEQNDSYCGKLISKNGKINIRNVVYNNDNLSRGDMSQSIASVFGVDTEEINNIIWLEDYDYPHKQPISRRTVLNRMLELAEKYGWELDY